MSAQPKSITSRDNSLLSKLRKLTSDSSNYRRLGEVWIEGEHLCSAFVQRGGKPAQAVISEEAWQTHAIRALAQKADAIAIVPFALMSGLSALESPAHIGFSFQLPDAQTIDPSAPSVVLDRLQDAGNVGNILRSAAAFGFTQIVAIKGTAGLWSPKVLRAGMGAHFGLKLIEGLDDEELEALKLPMLATSSHADRSIDDANLPWPCAWVLGHEGQGVSTALMERCAEALRIPQPGGEESLNVASAAAVCLYESSRQRIRAIST